MGIAQKFEKYVGLEQLYTELNAGQKKILGCFFRECEESLSRITHPMLYLKEGMRKGFLIDIIKRSRFKKKREKKLMSELIYKTNLEFAEKIIKHIEAYKPINRLNRNSEPELDHKIYIEDGVCFCSWKKEDLSEYGYTLEIKDPKFKEKIEEYLKYLNIRIDN